MLNLTQEVPQFRAIANEIQAFGETPRQALDALMGKLTMDDVPPIVIFPYNRGDIFWTAGQQARLEDLKHRRDTLTEEEHAEWESLVEISFNATIARTQTIPVIGSVSILR